MNRLISDLIGRIFVLDLICYSGRGASLFNIIISLRADRD